MHYFKTNDDAVRHMGRNSLEIARERVNVP